MNELIKSGAGGLVGLLHGAGGGLVPKPFERDIFLFDTIIAGTTHVDGIDELEPFLKIDDKLTFLREPDNPHDEHAIRIQTESGTKLGYVPRQDNLIFSRLMDAGKLLYAKISEKEIRGTWVRIFIKIYLQE